MGADMAGAQAEGAAKRSFFQVRELTHIHFPVTDLEKSARWYSEHLGLEVTFQQGERLVFLRLPASDNTLVLNAVKGKIPKPLRFGFKVSGGTVAIEAWRMRFKKAGLALSVRMRGERIQGLFLTDPDGHTVELYCE